MSEQRIVKISWAEGTACPQCHWVADHVAHGEQCRANEHATEYGEVIERDLSKALARAEKAERERDEARAQATNDVMATSEMVLQAERERDKWETAENDSVIAFGVVNEKLKKAERERDLHYNTIGEMQAKLDKANGRCTLDQMNERIMDWSTYDAGNVIIGFLAGTAMTLIVLTLIQM